MATQTQREFIEEQINQLSDDLFPIYLENGNSIPEPKSDPLYARLLDNTCAQFPELSRQECATAITAVMTEMFGEDDAA